MAGLELMEGSHGELAEEGKEGEGGEEAGGAACRWHGEREGYRRGRHGASACCSGLLRSVRERTNLRRRTEREGEEKKEREKKKKRKGRKRKKRKKYGKNIKLENF
jgi:hypothetical protein